MKNGLGGLKKKWHSSILKDIKRLGLPQPDHACGYSSRLLENSLSLPEWEKFGEWMEGQTCMLDEKLGIINYTSDVIRGLDYLRHRTPTYFD